MPKYIEKGDGLRKELKLVGMKYRAATRLGINSPRIRRKSSI